MEKTPVTVRDDGPRHDAPTVHADGPASPLIVASTPDEGPGHPSFSAVLGNRAFRALWIAQICSQLAQNLTWIALGAFVANQTRGSSTLVSITIVSAMLAQLLLSGFAGVLVDRASKRAVLLGSNAIRLALALLFVATTRLDVGVQTTTIIVLIFVANAVAQFFTPAESSTIPLLVEKRDLIAASSLFNITMNACQVIPVTLGLVLYAVVGIVPVLLGIALLYAAATALVATLPVATTVARPAPIAGSLREAVRHIFGDLREGLRFLSRDPGLRLTLFQINVAPTFLFVFGTLGYAFVQQTFGLTADKAWILLLPAGLGLVIGAALVGRVAVRARKEDLINLGLIAMGVAVAVLGAVAVVVAVFGLAAGDVGGFIAGHIHRLPQGPHNVGLIVPAMVIAFVIGVSMALSTIPAQTLVFERTSEEVRGRVLSMQQLVGGALPIIPLLTISSLADLFGTSTVMTGLGVVIVLVGAFGVHLDRSLRQ